MSLPDLHVAVTEPPRAARAPSRAEPHVRAAPPGALLGEALVASGALDPGDLLKALAMQRHQSARLGDILLAHGMVGEAALTAAVAAQWQAEVVDLDQVPPDPVLAQHARPEDCARLGFVPWRAYAGALVIATAHPERCAEIRAALPEAPARLVFALAPSSQVMAHVAAVHGPALAARAEHVCPSAHSVRSLPDPARGISGPAVLVGLVALAVLAPAAIPAAFLVVSLLALALNAALRLLILAHAAHRRLWPPSDVAPGPVLPFMARKPVVSVMVPLHKEGGILPDLVARLERLDYPRELLDILLVLEADDTVTEAALARLRLPRHIRALRVPPATLRTKPRAMNYALDFCRGSVIGIWDAEDAPEPDQVHKVVAALRAAPPEVACVQARLDFYNARQNWITRCFTLDYASWFTVFLPGLARIGVPVPLGGTSVFFRRAALEQVGRWDAHNVTEDCDLGIRLARAGYRCEIIGSTTFEEATATPRTWIRQRSRWQKGFALTWASHMRNPVALWRDLGAWPFIVTQVLLLGSLAAFLAAPMLWLLLLPLMGVALPGTGWVPGWGWWAIGGLLIVSELALLAMVAVATWRDQHRGLLPWAPILNFYWLMATLSAWKALGEVFLHPHYWDKTEHGHASHFEAGPGVRAAGGEAPVPDQGPEDRGEGFRPPRRAVTAPIPSAPDRRGPSRSPRRHHA